MSEHMRFVLVEEPVPDVPFPWIMCAVFPVFMFIATYFKYNPL